MNWVWWDFSYYLVFVSWLVNVPQGLRIIKYKDASQVSVFTYLALFAVLFCSFIHATRLFYYVGDWVFMLSHTLSMIINIWMLCLIKRYTPNFTYLGLFKAKFKKIKRWIKKHISFFTHSG